jgi:hypothetical protein
MKAQELQILLMIAIMSRENSYLEHEFVIILRMIFYFKNFEPLKENLTAVSLKIKHFLISKEEVKSIEVNHNNLSLVSLKH